MMKLIYGLMIALMAFAANAANADTINLDASNCGATRYCTTVYNDADPAVGITIAANPAAPGVTVYLNGVAYSSADGNAPGTFNVPVSIVDLTLTNGDGETLVLNATFFGKRVLHRSGHNYWTTQWTLVSGTID
jgi:hypothetical protein